MNEIARIIFVPASSSHLVIVNVVRSAAVEPPKTEISRDAHKRASRLD